LTSTAVLAEQFDLEAVCLPSIEDFSRGFSLPETIGIQLAAAKTDDATAKSLENCCGAAPLAALIGAVEDFEIGTCVGLANCVAPSDPALTDVRPATRPG
jgi:hypothetical protein